MCRAERPAAGESGRRRRWAAAGYRGCVPSGTWLRHGRADSPLLLLLCCAALRAARRALAAAPTLRCAAHAAFVWIPPAAAAILARGPLTSLIATSSPLWMLVPVCWTIEGREEFRGSKSSSTAHITRMQHSEKKQSLFLFRGLAVSTTRPLTTPQPVSYLDRCHQSCRHLENRGEG